jgi:phage terminase large subunit
MTIEPTKKQETMIAAALSGKYTMILFGGAVGGAKTAGLYLLFLIAQKIYPGIQVYFVRKDLATIERNSYATWNEITQKYGIPQGLKNDRRSDQKNPRLEFNNGSNLFFFGENYDKDKDLLRWSGLVPNWFFADEINELTEKAYKKMFERAGRYQLAKGRNPHPLIVGTCNPSQGWVKEQIYDKWEKGILPNHILYIPSKVTDNPHLPEAYIENLKNLPKYEYSVYVEGNWNIQLKTGGEFLKSFELDRHVRPVRINKDIILHISIDSNVLPYIAVSVWQIEKEYIIGSENYTKYHCFQVNELPAKDPINTARKSALNLVKWLQEIDYNDKLMIYGDPTTKNSNNIDEDKKSFFTLFTETLKNNGFEIQDKMTISNKSVSAMGDFVNAIFEKRIKEIEIIIGENCKTSINDYIETKQDKDGGILKKRITDPKTKATYEPTGHFTDNLKDFICQAFAPEFRNFKRKINDIAPIVGYRNKRY